jgi:hypothetical protein
METNTLRSRRIGWFLLLALASLGLAHSALAATRETVIRWLPPSGTVSGYRVHLGSVSKSYTQVLELGAVPTDPDGVGRSTLQLDATRDYYITLTAYNGVGESSLSNEIKIAKSACDPSACNDGSDCTADDCNLNGCTHTALPDATLCSLAGGADGMCSAGTCKGVQCTSDAQCSDGNACNGAETCSLSGSCTAGPARDCGAPSQCSVPICDPVLGCSRVARSNGTPCNDGRRWTINDVCRSGRCTGTYPRYWR